ncbi:unnamed protein product [Miscanthus lutarioriparius]|uniref:Uncharacterized protein n=1 Tax=Miscanthus lutarioriparius TaxID=422564 RepID=A0A811N4Q6_9POAL|nr:unnamed protein product [Miscanthus lutarioriparius]
MARGPGDSADDPSHLRQLSHEATEDIEFDGSCIPKGWRCYRRPAWTHMDPKDILDLDKFKPSRFESQAPPYSFVAFGGG